MESWRKVWREGLAPLLSDLALGALRRALREDDPRLLQGATTAPPPVASCQEWPVKAACLIGFCGWADLFERYPTSKSEVPVLQVEEFFARTCFEIDQRLNEPAGCRWLLNWFDEMPRDAMRELLLGEVELTIKQKSDGKRARELTR